MEKSTRKGNDEKTKNEFIETMKYYFVLVLIIIFFQAGPWTKTVDLCLFFPCFPTLCSFDYMMMVLRSTVTHNSSLKNLTLFRLKL